MNLREFKAWFEGFTENVSGTPNAKQWKRICDKVKLIVDAPPTSYPIFVDRWVRPYWYPYWQPYYTTCGGGLSAGMQGGLQAMSMSNGIEQSQALTFNSTEAFQHLGRAEALSVEGAA